MYVCVWSKECMQRLHADSPRCVLCLLSPYSDIMQTASVCGGWG